MEELNNIDVMHVIDVERVELVAYQLKNFGRNWFEQLKEGRDEDAPHPSRALKKRSLGIVFPRN